MSPVVDPTAWKQDAFQHPWDGLSSNLFPHFAILRQVLSRVMLLIDLFLVLVAPLWYQKEWFVDLLVLLSEELAPPAVESAGPDSLQEVS